MSFRFKIGTFNVLNLAQPHIEYYRGKAYTPEIYERKIHWIGQQLSNMGADIVGFQEVWSEAALRDALAQYPTLANAHIAITPAQGNTPSVAIASRFPIQRFEVIRRFPQILSVDGVCVPIEEFARAILQAEIKMPTGITLTFLVAHLKSKRPSLEEGESRDNPLHKAYGDARSLIRRLAEATALRAVLLERLLHRQTPVILVGDLNDTGGAVTTKLISGEQPFRKWPDEVRRSMWDTLLYHVKDLQARRSYQDFYFTHIHNGHHEALDHIMVSEELVSENPRSIGRVEYVRTFNDHLRDETLSDEGTPEWQSDHGQVVAEIVLSSR